MYTFAPLPAPSILWAVAAILSAVLFFITLMLSDKIRLWFLTMTISFSLLVQSVELYKSAHEDRINMAILADCSGKATVGKRVYRICHVPEGPVLVEADPDVDYPTPVVVYYNAQ